MAELEPQVRKVHLKRSGLHGWAERPLAAWPTGPGASLSAPASWRPCQALGMQRAGCSLGHPGAGGGAGGLFLMLGGYLVQED